MMTGHAGIFAGGDMVPADRNVTVAVGHGKKAARNIDAWLRGTEYAPPPKHAVATFDKLNTWYYADAPKTVRPDARHHPPPIDLRRSSGRSGRKHGAVRSPSLPRPAATASSATTAMASARTMPSSSLAPAIASSSTTTTARVVACAWPSVLVARSRWSRRRTDAHAIELRPIPFLNDQFDRPRRSPPA